MQGLINQEKKEAPHFFDHLNGIMTEKDDSSLIHQNTVQSYIPQYKPVPVLKPSISQIINSDSPLTFTPPGQQENFKP